MVHSLVTIITIEHEEDIALLAKGSWPHLGMVILPSQTDIPPQSIEVSRHRWQLLASLSLGEDAYGLGTTDVVLLLKSLHQPQYTTLDSAELAVKPLEHLLSSKWSKSGSLILHEVEETVIGTAVMAQLSKGRWQCLQRLEFCSKQL